MPERGGSSTIAGVDFETWYAALKFVDAFFDESIKVKPQAKTSTNPITQRVERISIDDLYVLSDKKQEFYNIKSIAPNRKEWTIGELNKQKVLKQLKEQFSKSPDAELYFVSQSPCLIIQNVLPIGAACESRDEIEIRLKPKNRIQDWDKIKRELRFSDVELMNFAKQVKYKHLYDIDEIKNLIIQKLYGHITNVKSAPQCLYQLAVDAGKYGKLVNRINIINFFEKDNIHLKAHLRIEELIEKLKSASNSLELYSGRLILDEPIERPEVDELINWIGTPLRENESQIAAITGKAGCGKTFILKDLFTKLQRKKIPVIGIKIDLLYKDSIEKLSNELGLTEGIKKTLAAIVERYEIGVILLDQIDALSLSSSKDRKFINTYFELISQLSHIKNLRIIFSCRSFDLKFDPTINKLEDKVKEIKVKDLSDMQIENVLIKKNLKKSQLTDKLFDLLKIPLHLKVFCDVCKDDTNIFSINNLHDLYDELWEQKISKISDNRIRNESKEVIDTLVQYMDMNKTITAPLPILDKKSNGKNYLLSESLIQQQGKNIQFFHSSFFDYCYARTFITRHDSLYALVLSQKQGLFVRSQIKQVLAYLRECDKNKYLKELSEFLKNPGIRFHVKLLVINQLAFQDDPMDEEWRIVKRLIDEGNELVLHILEGIQYPKWFDFLISTGYLEKLIKSKNSKLRSLIIWKLGHFINLQPQAVIGFLFKFPAIENKDEAIARILAGLEEWKDERLIQLYKLYTPFLKQDYFYSQALEKILKYHQDAAIDIFFKEINERIDSIKSRDDFDKRNFFGHTDIRFFEKLINSNQYRVLIESFKVIEKVVEKTKWNMQRKNGEYFKDSAFYGYDNSVSVYNHEHFLSVVIRNLQELAANNKDGFLSIINVYKKTGSLTLLKIIIECYCTKPELYINEGFNLLTKKGVFSQIETRFEYDIKNLLKKLYLYLSEEQKDIINNIIMNISPEWEHKGTKGQPSSLGYTKHKLIGAIPYAELFKNPKMKRVYQELERKFGKNDLKPPPKSEASFVGPPLPGPAYEQMSLDQWLSSFKKYDESTDWDRPVRIPGKGGIIEQHRAFTAQVKSRPVEFNNFIFDLGKRDDVSIKYFSAGIEGLVQAEYDVKKIEKIVKSFWVKVNDPGFRMIVINAIEYIDKKSTLDIDLINVLKDFALNDPDPKVENWKKEDGGFYGGDPLTSGINSVRGHAAWALGKHSFKTLHPDELFKIFDKISEDGSIAVRCCLIGFIQAMIKWNRKKTVSLFVNLTRDMNPLVIMNGLDAIYYLITKDNFKLFIPYFKSVINTNIETDEYSYKSIGEILMFAYVNRFPGSKALLEEGFKVNARIKVGAIDFAIRHLNFPKNETAKKSKDIYLRFLDDESTDVRSTYSWSFRDFKPEDFIDLYDLIYRYSKSRSLTKHSIFFYEFLEKCVRFEPEKCIDIMENCTEFEDPDSFTRGKPVQIVIEAYNKTTDEVYKRKAMDIFDSLLQRDSYKRHGLDVLKEYDRE